MKEKLKKDVMITGEMLISLLEENDIKELRLDSKFLSKDETKLYLVKVYVEELVNDKYFRR